MIFYESPRRLKATLAAVAETLGNRNICIARELSKIYEEYIRGSVEDIIVRESDRKWRGEITLVVAGVSKGDQEEKEVDPLLLKKRLQELVISSKLSTRDLVDVLQVEFPGWRKKDIYRLVLDADK